MTKNSRSKRSSASANRRPNVHRILNVIPSRNTEKDWTIDHAIAAGIHAPAAAIPASKDLREPSWWKINDQKATGSCVGWSSADGVIRWHMVKAGRLAKSDLLSPRFIWMAAKETDEFTTQPTTFIEEEGTSPKAALDIARKFGVVLNSVLPFASGHLYQGKTQTFYALAAQLRIASYFNLGINPANWRSWIANHGPILIALGVDATWDNASAANADLDVYLPNTIRGGHAVAIVGYTPSRFIIRNSWGTTWGDQGFAYASIPYATSAFTEAYGITV